MTTPPTSGSPANWGAITTPSRSGGGVSSKTASTASTTPRAPAARRPFPPGQRLHVLELATNDDPASVGCPAGTWSLDDLAATILAEAARRDRVRAELAAAGRDPDSIPGAAGAVPLRKMSRSTVGRVLAEADLKPHRSAYWLNSHDPDFGARAQEIGRLYLDAGRLWRDDGELVVCADEKTGILVRRRKHPTKEARPADGTGRGLPRRREHEYVRLGMRHLGASLCVPTGQVVGELTTSHGGADFCAHLRHAVEELPQAKRYHWVIDNNRTHSTPGVCATVAELSGVELPDGGLGTARERRAWLSDPTHRHAFHFTPVHGSWLNQVEMWFSVATRRLFRRDDFASLGEFVDRFGGWLEWYNREKAGPYRWTYAGTPLARGEAFARTRCRRQRGRAFFGPRPKRFERLFYPPRPYHKATPE